MSVMCNVTIAICFLMHHMLHIALPTVHSTRYIMAINDPGMIYSYHSDIVCIY